MNYTELLHQNDITPFPIFGEGIIADPIKIDLSDDSKWYQNLSNRQRKNQPLFQEIISKESDQLIISGYLENRRLMFQSLGYDQMVKEKRFFHLGLDFTMPLNTQVFCPLQATVISTEYESGKGNYGGRVILRHDIEGHELFSLYGHLNPKKLPNHGDQLAPGDSLGFLGNFDQNGGYWHHLHLQVITPKGRLNGFFDKGYCTKSQIKKIKEYCPDPIFLFRY